MKIQVIGDGEAARSLRAYVASVGYQVAERGAEYIVRMEEGSQTNVVLEGVRGALAEEAQHAVAELAGAPVEWRRAAAGSERELRVTSNGCDDDAVGRGVLRALLRVTGHGAPHSGMLRRIFSRRSK